MTARMLCIALAILESGRASANPCTVQGNKVDVDRLNASLVAKLENPPRTRVSLSVDGDGGFHRQIVWDPTVGDGLKHDVMLPMGKYTVLAHAEEDRVQTAQLVIMTTTQFKPCGAPGTHDECKQLKAEQGLLVGEQRMLMVSAAALARPPVDGHDLIPQDHPKKGWPPKIRLECFTGGVELSELHLDKKQLFAASVARGFLDQTAPNVVTDTLAILAEIAIERARTGALELVKQRFIDPICRELDLELLGLGADGERAFPRTCALLDNLALQDLLSAGRSLVEAARDDIRLTLVPRLVGKLDIPAAARDVAALALDLANQLLDRGNDVAEIDLLVTQLDRMFRRGAVASFEQVNKDFIRRTFDAIRAELGDATYEQRKELFLRAVLQRVLPHDPGALLSTYVNPSLRERRLVEVLRLSQVNACRRPKDEPDVYTAANLGPCIAGVIDHSRKLPDWGKTDEFFTTVFDALSADQLVGLAGSFGADLNLTGIGNFTEWLEGYARQADNLNALLSAAPPQLLSRTCAVRVTIAIVKWCSGRDTCTASEIATAFDRPETLFRKPQATTLDNLCWKTQSNVDSLVLPSVRTPYVELASRAVGFLTPPPKGQELERVSAILRWMFDLARTLDDKRASAVLKLQEILELFEKRDYVRAIGQTLTMAIESRGCSAETCSTPEALRKTMLLLGAVASYLQIYDDTKTADPAEARAARKKAITSLIDSSTDRKARAGHWIASLGIPVGFTFGARWAPGTDDNYPKDEFGTIYKPEKALSLRVPLTLSFQRMPYEGYHVGRHLAFTVADLGNFARSNAQGADDNVRWSDFLQFGAQAGWIFGDRRHSVVLAADLAWSPGLYRRTVMVGERQIEKQGALFLGATLAYYVPVFDLN